MIFIGLQNWFRQDDVSQVRQRVGNIYSMHHAQPGFPVFPRFRKLAQYLLVDATLDDQTRWMEMIMSRLVPVSLVSLLAVCAATTTAFAGTVAVPEPSSLALLASGMGIVYVAQKLRRRK